MPEQITHSIAIDAMGGDFGPRILIPSVLKFLTLHSQWSVFLVGKADVLSDLIQSHKTLARKNVLNRLHIVHADGVVDMDEKPAQVLRERKPSSMLKALELVQSGQAAAVVSAGNTGALMALSMLLLKRLPNVSRPAICGSLPSLNKHSFLLDMGANVDVNAQDMLCFAKMAKVLVQAVDNNADPSIALLNIGEEDSKGNLQVKETSQLLQKEGDSLNYIGFIEAHKIYQGEADIILCDGFVGNIALKASEGVASYILEKLRLELKKDWLLKLLTIFAVPQFLRLKNKVDPRRFNGAVFLGVDGLVVKSHGHADEEAFFYAIEQCRQMHECDVITHLRDAV